MYSSAADNEMEMHCPDRNPLDAVRSKKNWIGEFTTAAN